MNFWTKAFAMVIVAAFAACGANDGILRSGKPDANAANVTPVLSSADRAVADMRTASFTAIFVVRRKDGGTMDAEDRGVIRIQTSDANRRIGTDDDKAFVIGSNHPIAAEKMAALSVRFAIEDLSPPAPAEPANTANVNK
ncbi:MAG: hypothetical protein ABJA02_11240 [Acidobacteriota bacterium]